MLHGISSACHVHSEWSYDGKWSLPALAKEFKLRGYRVVMMTEHDRGFTKEKWFEYREACKAASSKELILVPGIEYSDPSNVTHILVWGAASFLGEGLATETLLGSIREQKAVAVLAHPARREAWKSFEETWCKTLAGIEVWNRKTDGWAPSKVATVLVRAELVNFAGLDFHDRRQFFPLSMQLVVEGDLNEDAIVAAFRSRRATACVFGRPLSQVLTPMRRFAFSTAEGIRRPLARTARAFLGDRATRPAKLSS